MLTTLLMLCLFLFYYFFFFSSRRRHTRFKCDWSSDVCSSDLMSMSVASRTWTRASCSGVRPSSAMRLSEKWAYRYSHIRSEERRVGKECRSRWWRKHGKEKEERVRRGWRERQQHRNAPTHRSR